MVFVKTCKIKYKLINEQVDLYEIISLSCLVTQRNGYISMQWYMIETTTSTRDI